MAESPEPIQNFSPHADRRIHARHRLRSLAYVELGENNGGIVINISEGGFAVRAAEAITEDRLPSVRFQMQNSEKQLVASGEIAWASDSRKESGMRFVDLPEEALAEIKVWISQEDSPLNFRKPSMSVARQSFRTTTAAREPFSGSVPDDLADRKLSDEVLQLNQGTIYAALLRFQQRGWITASWGTSENNRKARFYSITGQGNKQLELETENWERIAGVIGRVLRLERQG